MLRQVVLACFIATTASGPARATSLDDCSQNRSQEVRLRACSEIIAGQKALAFRNRCNASPLSRGIATPQRFALSGPGIDTIVAYTNSLSVTKGGSAKDRTVVPIVDAEDVGDARRGAAYAQKSCSSCHNVSASDAASPNRQAPGFKKIANTPGMTVTALTVWSRTSHPTMPNFVIDPKDMDDLIAYILSLKDAK